MRDIGKNIKQLRQMKNMTQDELAEKLFVTRQTISNYETGKSRPDVEMLTQIAETLGTDPNTVLYGLPQEVSRQRMLLKLSVTLAVMVVVWIGFCYVSDYARKIGVSTYEMGLWISCRIFGGPVVAFLFGWTAMQTLGVLAKLSPLTEPWAKRLRWTVIIAVPLYVILVLPFFGFSFLDALPGYIDKAWSYTACWLSGYLPNMHIKPNIILFGIFGCALWLGMPQKTKE